MNFLPAEIIRKKRDNLSLAPEEIEFFIRKYIDGQIPDYQASAFLMAIFFRGLNFDEMATLVRVMRDSGRPLHLKDISGFKIDKHSTGGVGDKISMILAPLLASMGLNVPMISGRGLAHSGGTLDKLESIPGLRTNISSIQFEDILKKVGFVISGQTNELVPADRKLYALRDTTATIDSIPLVVASIMSKKLAENLNGLVLDIKTGQGSFFPDKNAAIELAKNLIRVGEKFDVKIRALLTNMDQPLGFACGNWVEIAESIACLNDRGPKDVMELAFALAHLALRIAGNKDDAKQVRAKLEYQISSGAALEKFHHYVELMGGDVSVLENLHKYQLPKPVEVKAKQSGFVQKINALEIGIAAMMAGAGRIKMGDLVDPQAGIILKVKVGEYINSGDVLAKIFTNKSNANSIWEKVAKAFSIAKTQPPSYNLIFGEINSGDELIRMKE